MLGYHGELRFFEGPIAFQIQKLRLRYVIRDHNENSFPQDPKIVNQALFV